MNRGILWLVLTDSKRKLLNIVPPIYPVLFAHHVTLFYNVELSPEYAFLLGTKHTVTLKENTSSDDIQAVTVDIGDLPTHKKFPHITISAQKGIEPGKSEKMLEETHVSNPIPYVVTLEGIVEFKKF